MHKDFHGNKLITGEKEKEGERGWKREFKCILVVVWNTVYLSEKERKGFMYQYRIIFMLYCKWNNCSQFYCLI